MKIKIWDNFTRIYHMSQLILLALLWYSGEQGDFELHFLCGYILLSLWLTRIIWGFIGSESARFSHFFKSPLVVVKWLTTPHKAHSGHNPIAAYMVMALLTLLGIQLLSGLFATDDVLAEGPLLYYVSDSIAEFMDGLHSDNFDYLLTLIALHIVAAVIHTLRADNVIKTIITGTTTDQELVRELAQENKKLSFANSIVALIIWLIIFLLLGYFWLGEEEF